MFNQGHTGDHRETYATQLRKWPGSSTITNTCSRLLKSDWKSSSTFTPSLSNTRVRFSGFSAFNKALQHWNIHDKAITFIQQMVSPAIIYIFHIFQLVHKNGLQGSMLNFAMTGLGGLSLWLKKHVYSKPPSLYYWNYCLVLCKTDLIAKQKLELCHKMWLISLRH